MQKKPDGQARPPRGMSLNGPVLFSYGFRPFFLASAIWAILGIGLWMAFLTCGLPIASAYGATFWHAHEMLFGFGSAILAGFLLTAIPNWTGRLPLSGRPLALLFLAWTAGRVAMLASDWIGTTIAAGIDSAFLVIMLVLCAREVVAGRKWKDLKVIAGLGALGLANIVFHVQVLSAGDPGLAIRLGLAAYVLLVTIVGGRILPSFTRNWLNLSGRTDFPVPYNRFDAGAILLGAAALAGWVVFPEEPLTGVVAAAAALANTVRLIRWRGWTTWPEPIVFVLHAAFGFVPLGFAAIALGTVGLPQLAVLHLLAIGAVSLMMLAVMTRATRGHTGRKLKSGRTTNISYALLGAVALVRPAAELFPDYGTAILIVATVGWIGTFGLFLLEHAPMLCTGRKPLTVKA